MKDELTKDNMLMLDRFKSMGQETWPGTDRSIEEVMMEIEKKSQNILKEKLGYDTNNINNPKSTYYFITVNLTGDTTKLKDLYDRVQDAIYRYKWLRKSIINYEYYTQEGGHPHSHMVVNTNKRRDTIVKLFSTFFKVAPNYIDVKRYYGDAIKHINYVKGIKKEKDEYIEKDTYLRDELNIPPYTDNWE